MDPASENSGEAVAARRPPLVSRFGTTLLEIVAAKIELVQVEIEEERRRLAVLLISSIAIGSLIFLGVTLVGVFIGIQIYYHFPSYTFAIAGILVLLMAVGGVKWLMHFVSSQGMAFSETLAQLNEDIAWLKGQLERFRTED